jgi:hypothetical protein
MKKVCTCLALFAVAAALCLSAPQQASARPDYSMAFIAKYEKIAEAKDLKCGICHGDMGKNKKVISDYAKVLKEALGEKNVKDSAKIGAALDKAAEHDAGGGKTYGELFKEGHLPPPAH